MGDAGSAVPRFERAVAIARAAAPASLELALSLAGLGAVRRRQGRLDDAIGHLRQAVDVLESFRGGLGRSGRADVGFERLHPAYSELVEALVERARPGDEVLAFGIAERSRARVLSDLLAERDLDLRPQTAQQAALIATEEAHRRRAALAYNALAEAQRNPSTPEPVLARLAEDETRSRQALDGVRLQLRAAFPAYAELRYPQPAGLADAQALVDERTLLLEYALADETACVFAVRRDGGRTYPVPASDRALAALVAQAVGAYHRGVSAGDEAHTAQADLSRQLLGPLPAELWEGVERVVISADGALHFLPFELLPYGEDLLGDLKSIAYVPSTTTLRALLASARGGRPAPSEATLVGFGDPTAWDERFSPLPGSQRELVDIARRFGDRAHTWTGPAATEQRVRSTVAGHRFVHFATHGFVDDREPLYSGLVLSPPAPEDAARDGTLDGLLQAYELFGLELDGAVVTCSACETGLGYERAGEGLVGLSRALFYAGADSLVLSLWRVPDMMTARLMDAFYERLLKGDDVADALRQAKLKVRQATLGKQWRLLDPALWAAFVVVGLGWSPRPRAGVEAV